ncbi:MAG TPA: hypothetical protein VLK23_15790 [Thermodesulfobacteriota bacterium]|nr:hypothetical protein [Thermodesulfobacteriota bacterium]
MKKLLMIIAFVSFLLAPFMAYAQSDRTTGSPPVAQTLVREGDFAVKLADALKIGKPENEAEAESMLTSVGIAPRNGWIADYPVTPDIIGELETAIGEAADSNRLAMRKDEAIGTFNSVSTDLGLPVMADTTDKTAEYTQPVDYSKYTDPAVINDYYYNEGPPVVTYYPPPWDYDYLYAWVPSPFWFSGFYFPGFFVLHDFDRIIVVNKHFHKRICNHAFDPRTRRFGRIDPETRGLVGAHRIADRPRGFRSTEARNGASSIHKRSFERAGAANLNRASVSSQSGGLSERRGPVNRVMTPPTSTGRSRGSIGSSATRQWPGRIQPEARSPDLSRGSFSRPNISANRSETFRNPPASSEKSFQVPSIGSGRGSFQAPSGGGGFSRGGFSGGGRSTFSGGFSGGGGCRGRC